MISRSVEETEKIAEKILADMLKANNQGTALVVGLSGDLGAGKTAFTQAIAKHLGVKEKVNSPTFVLMKKYPVPKQAWYRAGALKNFKYKFLFHLDAYRLKNEKELLALGWEEIISDKSHIVFIEWPENVKRAMPEKYHSISIAHTKGGYRKFDLI